MDTHRKQLIDHISRLEGQLAAVKGELLEDTPDCVKASKTLHSAARSFATLRERFVEGFLRTHFIATKSPLEEEMLEELLTVIKG